MSASKDRARVKFQNIRDEQMALSGLWEDEQIAEAYASIPDGWRLLNENLPPVSKKQRVTIYIDSDVFQALKAEGMNWQKRARAILRSYVSLRQRKQLEKYQPELQQLLQNWSQRDLVQNEEMHHASKLFSAVARMQGLEYLKALDALTFAMENYEKARENIANFWQELPDDEQDLVEQASTEIEDAELEKLRKMIEKRLKSLDYDPNSSNANLD